MKKHTDTLIEKTKSKLQETFELKMNKHLEAFSFSSPIIVVGECKWLLAVTFVETTNSVFIITD